MRGVCRRITIRPVQKAAEPVMVQPSGGAGNLGGAGASACQPAIQRKFSRIIVLFRTTCRPQFRTQAPSSAKCEAKGHSHVQIRFVQITPKETRLRKSNSPPTAPMRPNLPDQPPRTARPAPPATLPSTASPSPASDRPGLWSNWRQSSTLLMSGERKRFAVRTADTAPFLDSTLPISSP